MGTTITTIQYRGERIIRERERRALTGVSRSHWHRLEREGRAPARIQISDRIVAWRLSDLERWVRLRLAGEDWREAA